MGAGDLNSVSMLVQQALHPLGNHLNPTYLSTYLLSVCLSIFHSYSFSPCFSKLSSNCNSPLVLSNGMTVVNETLHAWLFSLSSPPPHHVDTCFEVGFHYVDLSGLRLSGNLSWSACVSLCAQLPFYFDEETEGQRVRNTMGKAIRTLKACLLFLFVTEPWLFL